MSVNMFIITLFSIVILLLIIIYSLFAYAISRLFRRWLRCEYHKTCSHYTSQSYTCEHGGGNYCGTWRMLKFKEME